MRVVLKSHPATPSTAIDRIEVKVERAGEGDLKLAYRAFGAMDRVLLPTPTAYGRADELWRHTCFEAFVMAEGQAGYLELNFAPSSQWASYRFEGERVGMRPASVEPWAWQCAMPPGALEMEIDIAPGRLARPDLPTPDWRLGLSAVIEEVDGGISYWALAHPSDKPDFHHPDSFTLVLPAPEQS